MDIININTHNKYSVHVDDTGLVGMGQKIQKLLPTAKKVAVITDSTVDKLYGEILRAELESADFCAIKYCFEAGEKSKTLATYCDIINFLASNGLCRTDAIVALGGGVVGDITGFAAATYMRGIDYVQIPTTLLACVDSSVGGKTAVDLDYGKNLVGAFCQPRAVYIATELLQSLPQEAVNDGMGEILKYVFLEGDTLYDKVVRGCHYSQLIADCVDIKRRYVECDEHDGGERQKLNLGHTFGHAIERIENFSITHGEAVAIGLRYALQASQNMGIYKGDYAKAIQLLDEHNVGAMNYDISQLAKYMTLDKKNMGGKINFILLEDIGKAVIQPMTIQEMIDVFDSVLVLPSTIDGAIDTIASKSYAHRILIMASRANTPTIIKGLPNNIDTLTTLDVIEKLGATVERIDEQTIKICPITNAPKRATISVKESGSTMRFILSQIASLGVECEIFAEGRLPERSNAPLLECMTKHGIAIVNSSQPLTIQGQLTAGEYRIAGNVSSQYISGLMMALATLDKDSRIVLTTPLESKGYVDITLDVMAKFGVTIECLDGEYIIHGGQKIASDVIISVEGDWSNAAPLLALGCVSGKVAVNNLDINSCQGDKVIMDILRRLGGDVQVKNKQIVAQKSVLTAIDVSIKDCPDLAPYIAFLCANAKGVSRIKDVERLRIKESDRVESIISALLSVGIECQYDGDIVIQGGEIQGGTIDSAQDHRIAMLGALCGIVSASGVKINGASSVAKSYPDFYNILRSIGGAVDVR